MSELKKYECTVLIDASCGVTVEASSPEEAAELAENAAAEQGAGSLCHQCSNHTECGDSYAVIVYDGDKEIIDTDHRSKLLADAKAELAALREELAGWKQLVGAVCATIPLAQTLAGTATDQSMVQYFKGLHAERDNLQKYLTSAEQRNSGLVEALTEERRIRLLGQQENINWESLRDCRRACYAKTDAALKPESGASEPCSHSHANKIGCPECGEEFNRG